MACGIRIKDRIEGEPEITAGRGTRSYDEIERLQANFHRSAQSVLSVEVGPALEGPMTEEQIAELSADWAEGEIMEVA
jgi:hypothetical protein